eukprot:jgi/Ulvmu1/7361/UM036_0021.1
MRTSCQGVCSSSQSPLASGSHPGMSEGGSRRIWLEEDISEHLRWSISLKSILNAGQSEFQAYELVDTFQFGKLLMLDGKLQSAEKDERAYHECLVQPAMLHHSNPGTVFICGGGEGATAREVLRHASVKKCVMVDIDEAVCNFCRENLQINQAAFQDPRLELICDDARKQLEQYDGTFDVIIGDLADPVHGGPCYQLYTDDFYKNVIRKKLNPGGIFVTQSGPCGVLTAHEVFTPIHNTLKSTFPTVVPYSCHIPAFADEWGWNLAFKEAGEQMSVDDMDRSVAERIGDMLWFLDGRTWQRVCALSKPVRKMISEEQHILSVDNPKFIHGQGVKTLL